MQRVLLETLGGKDIRYTAKVGDSLLAAVHFTVRTDPERPVRSTWWRSPNGCGRRSGPGRTGWSLRWSAGTRIWTPPVAMTRYAEAFDEAYKEHYSPTDAVADLRSSTGCRVRPTWR